MGKTLKKVIPKTSLKNCERSFKEKTKNEAIILKKEPVFNKTKNSYQMKKETKGRVVIGALKDQKRIVTEYLKKETVREERKKKAWKKCI